jgi:hypothetical protein
MKKLFLLAIAFVSLPLTAQVPSHLPGELSAEDVLNGVYPWPPSPPVNTSCDTNGFAFERLTTVPPPGVHPRILISAEELPDLRRRVADTEMGRLLLKNLRGRVHDAIKKPGEWGTRFYAALAAGDLSDAKKLLAEKNGKPPAIGHYQPFIEAFAMEALDALISRDETRGEKVGAALANYAALAEPAIDGALAQPLGDDVWRVKLNGPTTGDWSSDQGLRDIVGYEILGYTYDFAYNFMTEAQRAQVRRVIAKMTRGELWMGARLPHHFRNWNWCAVGLSQPLLALAIEGEDGYDPRVFKMGVSIARDYFSYGISESGFSTEAVGYTQFGLVWANPFVVAAARRGENLLTQNHHRAMIDWYLHAMEPVALTLGQSSTNADWEQVQRNLPQAWTSHGDGGDEGPAIWTMAMWKYFFPHDPKIDLLWRVVANKNRGKPFTGNFHLIEALLFANDAPIALKPDAAKKLELPLALFDPKRSSLIAHSGWNTNSAVLQFECRTDSVGSSHEHADRGAFTFSALGRQWAKDNFRSVETRHHNSILIDGLGQGFWPGPGKWLGYDDKGWALVTACDAKACYDWWWPKEIKTEDPKTFERFKYSRWESNLADAEQFQKDFAGLPAEKDPRPSVIEHWQAYQARDPRMWDEDSWPVRLTNNPVQRAFRTVAFVREPQPYLLVVDDIQKDSQERLYEWLMQVGMNTAVARMAGNDVVLCDASVPLDADGVPHPRKGDRELLVRVLDYGVPAKGHDFQAKPSFRLETFERKDTLVPEAPSTALSGSRSFGLDKRLVIASRAAAPNFKILLWPLRAGEPLPEAKWNDDRTKLTVTAGVVTDEILFQAGVDGRSGVSLERLGRAAVSIR